jgi:hypothetical protein
MQRIQIHPPGGPIELEVDLSGAGERVIVFLRTCSSSSSRVTGSARCDAPGRR